MYVTPRPREDDDPLYPVRIALMPIIGFGLGMWLRSPMAMIFPVMMFSLLAGTRKAFNPGRALGAPIIFGLALWVMASLVTMLQGLPLVLVSVVGLVYVLAFYMIQKTGNAFGMLIAVAAVLTSIMGLGNHLAMEVLRVEMTKAAFASAVVIPLLYALLPPATDEQMVDLHVPAHEDQLFLRSLIRGVVLLVFSLWLYTFVDFSNVMLAVAAMFVLVFPTRRSVWAEAGQRSFSVLLGGVLAIAILALLQVSSHLVVLFGLMFATVYWLGTRMLHGPLPSMAYQDAASVMISLVGGALATSEPIFAFVQRAGLTVLGTIAAAFAVSLLEALLLKRDARVA
jgi:hypothetical protein